MAILDRAVMWLMCLLGFLALAAAVAAGGYADPDDDHTVQAAAEAARRLGPGRGAIGLVSPQGLRIEARTAEIVGLRGLGLMGVSSEVQKALQDLGARSTGTEIQISLSGDVLFDFDRWNIRREAEDTLHRIARAVRELKKRHMVVEGHTDAKGSEEYNQRLSERRAAAVRDWFLGRGGLQTIQIQIHGLGENQPVTPNSKPNGSDDPQGLAKNRRVEIRIPN